MRVQIDVARRDDEPVDVDAALRAHRVDAPDLGDPPGADRDVGGVSGDAGAVDDVATAQHEVEFRHDRPL